MDPLELSVINEVFDDDLTTFHPLTSNTVTSNSSLQLCTITSQSATTTSPSSLGPSKVTDHSVSGIYSKQKHFEPALHNLQQITEYSTIFPSPLLASNQLVSTVSPEMLHSVPSHLPLYLIIETVQFDPNIEFIHEPFDYDSNRQTDDSTSNNGQIEVLRVTQTVKTEEFKSPQNGPKRELDFVGGEEQETVKRPRSDQMNDEVIKPNTNEGADQCKVNGQYGLNDQTDGQLSTIDAQIDKGGHPDLIIAIFHEQVDIDTSGAVPQPQPWINNNQAPASGVPASSKFKCDFPECGKEFTRKYNLTCHGRVHNTSEQRPYVCDFEGCYSLFSNSHHLQDHMRTHTAQRQYKCGWLNCGAWFVKKSHLTMHYNQMHNRQ